MTNIPIDIGIILTDYGVEIGGFVGDYEISTEEMTWDTLIEQLLDGYKIPNHRSSLMISSEDFDHLITIVASMQSAADRLSIYLDRAEIV